MICKNHHTPKMSRLTQANEVLDLAVPTFSLFDVPNLTCLQITACPRDFTTALHNMTTIKSSTLKMSLFRPFCDSCGQRFEEGQLRPLSKYCTYCGQELSPWLRRIIADGVVA